MNIFNFKKKDQSDNQPGYNMSDGNEIYQPEAEDSLGGRNAKRGKVTVDCGTNYPIDVIYSFINKDFEEKGYNDAMCNLDASYLQTGKDQIRNELISMFNQIKLKYKGQIAQLNTQIALNKSLLLLDMADKMQCIVDTFAMHMEEIDTMEQRLNNNDPDMLNMVFSYERGFKRGAAAKSADLIKQFENIKETYEDENE